MPAAQTQFATATWGEETFEESPGQRKMTRVKATYTYTGTIEGTSTVEYLMVYRGDDSGQFVGLERLDGQIADKIGSCILKHTGTFDAVGVTSTWSFVPGASTGELRGLNGQGTYALTDHGPYTIDFTYSFENPGSATP